MGSTSHAVASAPGTTRSRREGEGGDWPIASLEDDSALDLYTTEQWMLASRIATSKGMTKSELLPRFLLYICEMSLRGREEEITEQRIGMVIFKRPAGYNPGEDNIVRSYARTLRKRLEDYFQHEGSSEALRITIPRGGYVPVFEPADFAVGEVGHAVPGHASIPVQPKPLQLSEGLSADVVVPKAAPAGRRTPPILLVAVLSLIAGVLLAAAWFRWTPFNRAYEPSAAHELWAQLFQPNRNTLIVPADSGLGILENLSKHSVTVEQYANGAYLNALAVPGMDADNFADIGQQRYTSVTDLNMVARLSRLPEYLPGRTLIRYARGVTADDIKSSNVILIGSKHTNPWVTLLEGTMNFSLEYMPSVDKSFIQNHAPQKGERAIYSNAATGTSGPTYGVIAYLPGLGGSGHVLIVEGLNMAGTEAAAQILFYDKLIGPALQGAKRADGSLRPFELLVETSSVGAISPEGRVVAWRFHE